MIAARAVAVNTASFGMPLSARALKMLGLTARMYAIVRNVVIPAITSVLTFIVFLLNPNNLFSIRNKDSVIVVDINLRKKEEE